MVDFFVDTYETELTARERTKGKDVAAEISDDEDGDGSDDDEFPRPRKRGRPANNRIRYLPEHPLAATKQRIKRSSGHNNLPNFIGHYFPCHDDPEIWEFYCACMLVLLKPWRKIQTDLKAPSESWEGAFNKFINKALNKILQIVSSIQYLHECKTAAKERHDNSHPLTTNHTCGPVYGTLNDELDLGEDVQVLLGNEPQTEEGLADWMSLLTPLGEELHG